MEYAFGLSVLIVLFAVLFFAGRRKKASAQSRLDEESGDIGGDPGAQLQLMLASIIVQT